MSERDADDAALDLLLTDAARVEALRGGYEGRHDLADVIWWRRHPLTTSPAGVPDPATRRDALQRAAFARHADLEAVTALASLERELSADARALDGLLRRVAPVSPSEEDGSGAAAAEQASPAVPPRWKRPERRLLLATLAVVAIAALGVTCVALATRLSDSEAILSGAAPEDGGDPLDRLDRAQRPDDVPEAVLPYDYDPGSVRRLLAPDQTGLTDDYVLYGARDDSERVCLVVAFPDRRIAASCVSLTELRQQGVQVTANVYRASRASIGSQVLVSHTVTWQPNDTFEFSSSLADGPP